MKGILVAVLGIALVAPAALAKGKKDKDDEEEPEEASKDDEEEESSEEEDGGGGGDDSGGDDEGGGDGEGDDEKLKDETAKRELPPKQNLSGHDMGTSKKENLFEKDRFFVDKVDTEKTQNGTLIQGSIASSSFLHTEAGDNYENMPNLGSNAAKFSRLFTELRLQTDFRHIAGSRWEARVDARARLVTTPDVVISNTCRDGMGNVIACSVDATRIQSGFNGTNEYDIRELWLFRSGKRSDIFFGRQFVPDLGGIKFDGLRVDVASSRKLTYIGFGGLYPLRGSRSLTTDYQPLKDNDGNAAGRLVGAGGFGAAYRTINAYGAFGGVALVPFAGEQPRFFVTGTGYWRNGSTLDIYHFGLVDVYSSQGAGLTNVSVGANYKPNPRLRLTAALNRVDVDTLAVQANAFLQEPDTTLNNVQNETYFRRLATNTARGGVSAGLGEFQRFEVSVAASYRYRPAIAIPVPVLGAPAVNLQGNKGVELFGSIVDRRSIKNLRLGVDVSRTFGVGGDTAIAFNRSTVLAARVFAARELANGHGEWEGEVTYSTTRDSASSIDCVPGLAVNVAACYGSSTGSIISLGGNLYYRINRDWMALGSLFLSRQTLMYYGNNALVTPREDPTVTGLTGYGRIAYRF